MADKNQQLQRKSLRLLIVDDNVFARSGMKALLETVPPDEGELILFEAANGQEALQQIETARPDVVLMDVKMPLLNGIEATRLIKQRWPDTKVVILTMYAAHQSDALAAGADRFLLKGSSPEALFTAIFW